MHRSLLVVSALVTALLPLSSRAEEPPSHPQLRGDWVPEKGDCSSPLRFRVTDMQLILVNGKDMAAYGNVAWPNSYFGPDYTGISLVAIAEWEGDQPVTAFFNEAERKGTTVLNILQGDERPGNETVNALVRAGRALNQRFPLDKVDLKKCPAS